MSAVIGVVECPSLFGKIPLPVLDLAQRNFTPITVARIRQTSTFIIVVKFPSTIACKWKGGGRGCRRVEIKSEMKSAVRPGEEWGSTRDVGQIYGGNCCLSCTKMRAAFFLSSSPPFLFCLVESIQRARATILAISRRVEKSFPRRVYIRERARAL